MLQKYKMSNFGDKINAKAGEESKMPPQVDKPKKLKKLKGKKINLKAKKKK